MMADKQHRNKATATPSEGVLPDPLIREGIRQESVSSLVLLDGMSRFKKILQQNAADEKGAAGGSAAQSKPQKVQSFNTE